MRSSASPLYINGQLHHTINMTKQKRKCVGVVCYGCKKQFKKALSEVKRTEERNSTHWCSLSCKAIFANNGKPNLQNLKSGNKTDEYSPFRYCLRRILTRNKKLGFKETNITLKNLKELWEKQKGICPLTGWKLTLPLGCKGFNLGGIKPDQASIDRITPKLPYTIDNIRYVAYISNMCKSIFTDEDVINFCKAVVKNN